MIEFFTGALGTIVPFLVVLGVVIFVHEYGHYIVGRWSGIKAEVFSIGFGPEILGWVDARGTRWRLAWIPLGGYVRFKGDADAAGATADGDAVAAMSDAERRTTMPGAPLWARAATVAAGPLFNFIFAIGLFAAVFAVAGVDSDRPVATNVDPAGLAAGMGFEDGDEILSVDGAAVETYSGFLETMWSEDGAPRRVVVSRGGEEVALFGAFTRPARVDGVSPGGAAERACLAPGDVILSADGRTITSFADLREQVEASEGEPMTLVVQRGGDLIERTLTPELVEAPDLATGRVSRQLRIGVVAQFDVGMQSPRASVGPLEALSLGVDGLNRVVFGTLTYLADWIGARVGGDSLGGPLGIAQASGAAAEGGWLAFVGFIATISAAIGLINLFPIPILDGGHLVFYAVEAVRRRPLSEDAQELAARIGLGLVLALVVFATYNDVTRISAGVGVAC